MVGYIYGSASGPKMLLCPLAGHESTSMDMGVPGWGVSDSALCWLNSYDNASTNIFSSCYYWELCVGVLGWVCLL